MDTTKNEKDKSKEPTGPTLEDLEKNLENQRKPGNDMTKEPEKKGRRGRPKKLTEKPKDPNAPGKEAAEKKKTTQVNLENQPVAEGDVKKTPEVKKFITYETSDMKIRLSEVAIEGLKKANTKEAYRVVRAKAKVLKDRDVTPEKWGEQTDLLAQAILGE